MKQYWGSYGFMCSLINQPQYLTYNNSLFSMVFPNNVGKLKKYINMENFLGDAITSSTGADFKSERITDI